MTRIRLVALTAVALLGLGACSSDDKSSGDDVDLAGGTLPGDSTPLDFDTIPDEILPGNLTDACRAISLQFAVVMSHVFAPTGEQADLEQVFGDISSKVPSELRADVEVLGKAFASYAEVLKTANNDYTNPDVQAALEEMATPEVEAATQRLDTYFDATCPQG